MFDLKTSLLPPLSNTELYEQLGHSLYLSIETEEKMIGGITDILAQSSKLNKGERES
jgi:hypothetical protein